MAKWYGMIGYGKTVETSPSVFTEKIVERPYYGDIGRDTRRLQTSVEYRLRSLCLHEFSHHAIRNLHGNEMENHRR